MVAWIENLKQGAKTFCTSQETPRWALCLGAITTIALSTLLSTCTALYVQDTGRIDDHRAENVRVLVDSMAQFQVFASTFASEMASDGKVKTETRANLIGNLNDQFARLKMISEIVPPDDQVSVEAYRQKISSMIETVHKTNDLTSMKDFWTATSDLLVARNKLNHELQTSI